MGKYLGQHFLINKEKLRKIVEVLKLKDGDVIIEIGSGHGELTSEIVSRFQSSKVKKFKIIAIEKDIRLAVSLELLAFRNKLESKIEIIKGDVLKILPGLTKSCKLKAKSYKIVGNIPFYITGYLLRILGELENKPFLIVLTIQKEVAERVCAKKGDMNLLAASVQFWAKLEIVGYISKKDFQPEPEVDSAIIKFNIRKSDFRKLSQSISGKSDFKKIDADKYYKFIKVLFKQPRKTIINNLRPTTNDPRLLTEKLKSIGVEPNARPQDLSIEQIKELSTLF